MTPKPSTGCCPNCGCDQRERVASKSGDKSRARHYIRCVACHQPINGHTGLCPTPAEIADLAAAIKRARGFTGEPDMERPGGIRVCPVVRRRHVNSAMLQLDWGNNDLA